MFDKALLAITKPIVDAAAREASRQGITANQATVTCFGLGMLSVPLIILGLYKLALTALLLGRLCDGLGLFLTRLRNLALGQNAFGYFKFQVVSSHVGKEAADGFSHLMFGDEVIDFRRL